MPQDIISRKKGLYRGPLEDTACECDREYDTSQARIKRSELRVYLYTVAQALFPDQPHAYKRKVPDYPGYPERRWGYS